MFLREKKEIYQKRFQGFVIKNLSAQNELILSAKREETKENWTFRNHL